MRLNYSLVDHGQEAHATHEMYESPENIIANIEESTARRYNYDKEE